MLTLLLLVGLTLSFVTIYYNAGHAYTMQELVKEVTQYGSTVYIGIAMGGPAYISVFTFNFNLNLSSKDIKVENM